MKGMRFLFTSGLLAVSVCLSVTVCLPVNSTAREPGSKLYRQLIGNNEIVRLQALALAQRTTQQTPGVIDDLIHAANFIAEHTTAENVVWPSTVELLYTIGSFRQPESESALVELLDANHSGIAMVAADALGKYDYDGAVEFLKRQVDRPEFQSSYGFRFNLVRAMAQLQHADAVEFLDQLKAGLDGQLHFEIERLLSQVTEGYFDGDDQRYAAWQKTQAPKLVLTPASFDSESKARMRLMPQRQYYGIDIHAKRMMFIIDHSGSMNETVYGVSRLERAKRELIAAIEQLPPDAEFAIMFYSDSVRNWRQELMPANDENKRQAIVFVSRLDAASRTNTYGALKNSLEFDDDLEAVFLLTDGRPTMGDIVAPPAIIADIVHRNRFRHLNFNTIGIAVDGGTEQFLRSLAELSAGEFRQADR